IVLNPIANTIVSAGEKMKISWVNSHADSFDSIYLIQMDGDVRPVVIARNVPTKQGEIEVDLPHNLIPSNAYYMTLGSPPFHCYAGNLRIVGSRMSKSPKILIVIKLAK
ncbi:hypothetical protein BDF20DRAFT_811026, partial [Mycotypha africana]|uniref:uncharacterized protein n=1 Tax=Mycotypha africana TaxID=64632 RepID=UPI00230043D5